MALLILGIMSALGYGTYRAARISAERTEESLKRSREIEFGMRMMVMDFAQMVPRPVRDPLGQTRMPALHGFAGNGTSAGAGNDHARQRRRDSGSDFTQQFNSQHFNSDPGFQSTLRGGSSTTTMPLAELTRAGWSNTAGQQRSTLQRVSYALVDDVLKRSYTTALDTVQGTQAADSGPVRRREDRPAALPRRQPDLADASGRRPTLPPDRELWTRPVAVEITIEFKDWGRVRRLVEVAG